MYYTVYQITNTINSKIYIGVHITSNLDDGYMGSGVLIRKSIKKHGVEKFNKKILHIYDNAYDMFEKEKMLVNEEFISRKDTYNVVLGGKGSWDYVNNNGFRVDCKNHLHTPNAIAGRNKFFSDSNKVERWKNRIRVKAIGRFLGENSPWLGKKHSLESRLKMKLSKNCKGENNSQFGTCWIHKNDIIQKIKKDKLEEFLVDGWALGRKDKLPKKEKIYKIKEIKRPQSCGNKNSQFGTCWIHNDQENKKIKKEDLDKWTALGYVKGRNINI